MDTQPPPKIFDAAADAMLRAAAEIERHVAAPPLAMPSPALPAEDVEAVSAFVNMARHIYQSKGLDHFNEWIAITFDALPEAEQTVIVSALLRIAFVV